VRLIDHFNFRGCEIGSRWGDVEMAKLHGRMDYLIE
jgi:hypothetical protein